MVIESVPLLEILISQGMHYENEITIGNILFLSEEGKKTALKLTNEIIDAAVNEIKQIHKNNE